MVGRTLTAIVAATYLAASSLQLVAAMGFIGPGSGHPCVARHDGKPREIRIGSPSQRQHVPPPRIAPLSVGITATLEFPRELREWSTLPPPLPRELLSVLLSAADPYRGPPLS
ncbi:MAG: hypothetical protein AB1428_10960 [Bacteroidota bacterium]